MCSTLCNLGYMAGGMDRTRGRRPLSERVAVAAPTAAAASAHCWVVGDPQHPGRLPALLLEWQQRQDGWWGRVVYVIPDRGGDGQRLVERWIAAAHLKPLG